MFFLGVGTPASGPCPFWGGGYPASSPMFFLGVPQPMVPCPFQGVHQCWPQGVPQDRGTPWPGQNWSTPQPREDWDTPSLARTGLGYPPPQPGQVWGTTLPTHQDRTGVPPARTGLGYPPLAGAGVPPPPPQENFFVSTHVFQTKLQKCREEDTRIK